MIQNPFRICNNQQFLYSAFRVPKNRSQLDQLFSLTLHSSLQNPEVIHHGALTSHASKAYTDSVCGVRRLNLSQENKVRYSTVLYSSLQNPEVIHHGALTSHASKAYTDSVCGVRRLNLSQENKVRYSTVSYLVIVGCVDVYRKQMKY